MTAPTPARPPSAAPALPARHSSMAQRYAELRARMPALAAPLSEADCQAQSMPDASPVKWHLAHVTWFFETFVLEAFERDFRPHHPAYRVLFNSYYQAVGDQHPRAERGLITRPGLAEVLAYRRNVDERMAALLQQADAEPDVQGNCDSDSDSDGDSAERARLHELVALGMQHEQQHQELLLTDLKHLLSKNPLFPVYRPGWPLAPVAAMPLTWVAQPAGLTELGHDAEGHSDSDSGAFAFDNESPRHRVWLRAHALANRLVTHGEWAEFVADGGYREARWWLSAGWDWAQQQRISAPMYWHADADVGERWHCFTLHGLAPLDPHTPMTHINLYEADAYARWRAATDAGARGARLPTEAEWEHAAAPLAAQGLSAGMTQGNFVESRALHPMPVARREEGLLQLFGDCWEWTASAYSAYPGYQPWAGAVGEYNGKFMIDQTVLRGGSCVSPRSHLRASYRNFFPAMARWQFSGLRLARDLD